LRRDYGAAGLYVLARQGLLDHVQVVVSVVTITLFIPCIAQFMVMIKERGWKVAMGITTTVLALAFLVGGGLSFLLRALNAQF
jgi:ferrous iron transport protein B